MINPIFDTGVFLIMLIVSIVLFFASNKSGILLLLLSTSMFFIVGIALVTGYDVVSFRTTTDGVTLFNETNYFIKNTVENGSTQWLGWTLLVFGLISTAKFLSDVGDKSKKFL